MENLAISGIDASLYDLGTRTVERPKDAPSFGQTLERAIDAVDALQQGADAQATKLAMGGGNLHETAIALEQADIAMRVATKVRNKLVEAYQEVMRMSV